MKTIIAALALVLLAASPTFAVHARNLQQGGDYYAPQSGSYGGADTSREGLIHAN
jgi:hypothetical protein